VVKFSSENALKNNKNDIPQAAKEGLSHLRAVILVGFMGAGKSSVGRVLAGQLGWEFVDLDQRIERLEGKSVAEIFRSSGEEKFRRMELDTLQTLLSELHDGRSVIALGGGAFVQEPIAALIEASGIPTVFLDAEAEELLARCQEESKRQGSKRPLLESPENFRQLYETRRPGYLKASFRKETGSKAVKEIADELIEALGLDKGLTGTGENE
jgi:shikimate kinase